LNEYRTPSHNEKGNMIDGGGIHSSGRFIQRIKRRKGGRIDIIVENGLGDKTTIQPEWIRWERTEYYNQKKE